MAILARSRLLSACLLGSVVGIAVGCDRPTDTTQPAAPPAVSEVSANLDEHAAAAPRTGSAIQFDGDSFRETFDGNPSAPGPWRPAAWDVQQHTRDVDHWHIPEALHAQHGPDCAGPPATHPATTWDATVFLCRDHLMTALNASDYGLLYITPPALIDFSEGPAIVQWEMSTERMSIRDWIDVTISPWEDNVARPLLSDLSQEVDLHGPPRNAVHLSNDTSENSPLLRVVRDGVVTAYNQGWETPPLGEGIARGTDESATRQTFRLTLSATRVRFERLASATAPSLVFLDEAIAALGWQRGVVQFGHHSYTPTKDNAGVPGTWHWDTIEIRPAVPFTIAPAGVHLVQSDRQVVTLPQAAPPGAMLRFAATSGEAVQVSFDGGPFQPARQANQPVGDRFKAVSYWTPVPAGTRSIRFRGTGGWWGDTWRVEDPHLWAPAGR